MLNYQRVHHHFKSRLCRCHPPVAVGSDRVTKAEDGPSQAATGGFAECSQARMLLLVASVEDSEHGRRNSYK